MADLVPAATHGASRDRRMPRLCTLRICATIMRARAANARALADRSPHSLYPVFEDLLSRGTSFFETDVLNRPSLSLAANLPTSARCRWIGAESSQVSLRVFLRDSWHPRSPKPRKASFSTRIGATISLIEITFFIERTWRPTLHRPPCPVSINLDID